jgi:hypothetical protein
MRIVVLEINKDTYNDIQHKEVEIEGTLEDYRLDFVREIKGNDDLHLIMAKVHDSGQAMYATYYSDRMSKMIRHYALKLEEITL